MIYVAIDFSSIVCYYTKHSLSTRREHTLQKGSDEPQRSRLALSGATSEINKDSAIEFVIEAR